MTSTTLRPESATTSPPRPEQSRRRRHPARFVPMWPGLSSLACWLSTPRLLVGDLALPVAAADGPKGVSSSGFRNYIDLLTDPVFWHSVQVTLVFVVFSVVLEFCLAFGLGLVFFRGLPGDK